MSTPIRHICCELVASGPIPRPGLLLALTVFTFATEPQCLSQTTPGGGGPQLLVTNTVWAREFFQNCAFVCVDIQPAKRTHVNEAEVPKLWRKAGFTARDVNAATDYAFDVAYPNARKVVDACRSLRLPMIFVHWGCLFRDGMDLDPEVRKELQGQHGTNYLAWGHCVQDASARPADELGVRPGDYVLPKSGQDAFQSSNIGFLLTNLSVRNIVFIGATPRPASAGPRNPQSGEAFTCFAWRTLPSTLVSPLVGRGSSR